MGVIVYKLGMLPSENQNQSPEPQKSKNTAAQSRRIICGLIKKLFFARLKLNKLLRKLKKQDAQIDKQAKKIQKLSDELKAKKDYIAVLLYEKYGGAHRHNHPEDEGNGDPETDENDPTPPSSDPENTKPDKRQGRKRSPSNLEEKTYDIKIESGRCPHDGHELECIGHQSVEKLLWIPARLVRLIFKIYQYKCPHCGKIYARKRKDEVLPKCAPTPALLAYIIKQKVVNGLPLHRIAADLKRAGANITRGMMARWLIDLGRHFRILNNLICSEILDKQTYIHLDETFIQVLETKKKNSYLWGICAGQGPPITSFQYAPTREGKIPLEFLADYHDAIQADGYKGYNAVTRENNLLRLGCWAHAIRKFKYAAHLGEDDNKKGKNQEENKNEHKYKSHAQKFVDLISKICDLDHEANELIKQGQWNLQDKQHQREQTILPLVEELRKLLDNYVGQVLDESNFGKAVKYLDEHWQYLLNCFKRPEFELTNNLMEQQIRLFVVGRKNWLFAQSEEGMEATADVYSVIKTAQACKLDIEKYLCYVLEKIATVKTEEEYSKLLPMNIEQYDPTSNLEDLWKIYFSEDFE